MRRLFSNPKLLAIAVIAVAALLISIAGGALGAAFGFGFLGGPLPLIQIPAERVVTVFGYDLMNTTVMFWASGIVLLTLAYFATRRLKDVPGRLQNVFEIIVEFFDNTADSVAGGPKRGRRFLPLVLAIFLGVLASNWLGILPGVGTIGRVETVEEFVHHHLADDHPEYADAHLDEVPEDVLREVLEASATEEFVVFNGQDGVATIPVGRGEEAKVQLQDVVDIDHPDIHHVIEDVEAGVVKRAPQPEDDPDKYAGLVGHRTGLLVPYFRGASTDLNTTLAIAIVAMVAVQLWGIRALGFRTYSGKFLILNQGPIGFFVGILEGFGEIARTISFTFRLFGNMFAGEILLIAMAFLLPLIGIIPFLGLELFVGAIQAFIFAMLTLVFGVMAVAHHGDDDHHGEEAEAH